MRCTLYISFFRSGACTWVVLPFIAHGCPWLQNQEKEPGLVLPQVLGPKANFVNQCLLVLLRTSCLACENPWKFATKWRCLLQVMLMGSEQQFTNGGCRSVCGVIRVMDPGILLAPSLQTSLSLYCTLTPHLFTSSKIKLLCKQPRSICYTVKNTLAWKYWTH